MPRDPVIQFYGRVFEYVWSCPRVPQPQELADWIESRTWRVDPEWRAMMVARLRAWPAGKNYPLVPDDEAMELMVKLGDAETSRWWEPGAIRGDLQRAPLTQEARRQAGIKQS